MKQRVVVSHRSSGIRNIFKSRTGWCYHLLTCQGRSTPYVGDGRPLTFNDGILGPWGPINPYGLGLMSLSPKYMEIMGVDRPDRTYQNKIWRTMVQNPQQNETFFLVRDRDTPRSPRVLSKHVLQLGCHSLFYYLYSWICWADIYIYIIYIYTWNPNDLYSWRDPTAPKQGIFQQKQGAPFGWTRYI